MAIATPQRRSILVAGIVLGIGAVYALLHYLTTAVPGGEPGYGIPAALAYLVFFAVILGAGFAVFKGLFAAERLHDERKHEIGLKEIPRDQDEVRRMK